MLLVCQSGSRLSTASLHGVCTDCRQATGGLALSGLSERAREVSTAQIACMTLSGGILAGLVRYTLPSSVINYCGSTQPRFQHTSQFTLMKHGRIGDRAKAKATSALTLCQLSKL